MSEAVLIESPDLTAAQAMSDREIFDEFIAQRDLVPMSGELMSETVPVYFQKSTFADVKAVVASSGKVEGKSRVIAMYATTAVDSLPAELQASLLERVPVPRVEYLDLIEGNHLAYGPDVNDHRLSVLANGYFMANGDVEKAALAAALCVQFESGMVSFDDDQLALLHDNYLATLTSLAVSREIPLYVDGVLDYRQYIEDTYTDEAKKSAALAQLDSLRFSLVDPISLYRRCLEEIQDEVKDGEVVIHTAHLLQGQYNVFNVAGTYHAATHTVELPLLVQSPEDYFRGYLRHELKHGLSLHVRKQVRDWEPRDPDIEVKRVGFMTIACSKRLGRTVVMHTFINEAYNEYKALLDAGRNPMDPSSVYYENRQILGKLIEVTGLKPWADFYSPRSSFDKQWRQDSFRALNQALSHTFGPGFLNRLDTTWAVYGPEHILDMLYDKAYQDIWYIPIRDIKAKAEEVEKNTINLEIMDFDVFGAAGIVGKIKEWWVKRKSSPSEG